MCGPGWSAGDLKVPTVREDLEKELASHPDRVLVLAGAGVACATNTDPCAYWSGLLKNGLQRCRDRCHNLSPDWATITELSIKQNTADELIQAASRIEKALRGVHDGEYGRWLTDSVGALKLNDRRTIDAILSWGTRIATTNYDNLFEDASKLQSVVWDQRHLALQVLRGDLPGILHLHGHYLFADSVVFGARTYEDICRDEQAQNMLRSVLSLNTVVFVGCGAGVDDPNFGGLLKWSKEALKSCLHTHYHLIRTCELEAVAKQYQGLRVTPVVYGENYADLGPFLVQVSEGVRNQARPLTSLDSLMTRQTDYDSQRRDLDSRTDLSPLEYVRLSFELARSLWDAGGHRTAALHMQSALRKSSGMAVADRIEFILQAVEYLLQDDLDLFAMNLLGDAEKLIQQAPVALETHARFRRLLARCLVATADLNKLEQVINVALPTAPPEERARLEAERAEYHMLSGDLAQAERDVGQEGRT